MRTDKRFVSILLLSAAAIAGCQPKVPAELCTREQLIDQYNTNADKVPELWAVADVEICLTTEMGGKKYRLPDGRLLVKKHPDRPFGPHDFMLRGKAVGREFFRLGIDARAGEYYFWLDASDGGDNENENAFARWGRIDELNRMGYETLPIDPTQLLNVLGIVPWPWDANRPWQVVYTPILQPCVYDLLFADVAAGADGPFARSRVWLDRYEGPHRPLRMWLYDRQGRYAMEAELRQFRTIETGDDKASWPVMPTDILIRWPFSDTIGSIRLRISGQTVTKSTAEAAFRKEIPPHIRDARQLGPASGGGADQMEGER
ncbi:MAG: hypothetical protein HQ546_09560 [Planctomycetes bacterium]|nr:hypothetical protein [Planctomycetota bacterium]